METPLPPLVPPNWAYTINDTGSTMLYQVNQSSGLGIQHFAALESLFETTERFDRLHLTIQQMFFNYLRETDGSWGHEISDLEDVAALCRFLSACYRQPTPTELQQFLRPHS